MDLLDQVDETYGIDEVERIDTGDEGVHVPETTLTLSSATLQQLQRDVDPLCNSENNAIELYERALHILRSAGQ